MTILSKFSLPLMLLGLWANTCQAGEVAEVKIEKMEFVPQHITVKAGTTITWTNMEKRSNHSIYFQKESLPESDRLFPGESWQRVFDKPGVFPYICGPHPDMTGVVEVTP